MSEQTRQATPRWVSRRVTDKVTEPTVQHESSLPVNVRVSEVQSPRLSLLLLSASLGLTETGLRGSLTHLTRSSAPDVT